MNTLRLTWRGAVVLVLVVLVGLPWLAAALGTWLVGPTP